MYPITFQKQRKEVSVVVPRDPGGSGIHRGSHPKLIMVHVPPLVPEARER